MILIILGRREWFFWIILWVGKEVKFVRLRVGRGVFGWVDEGS